MWLHLISRTGVHLPFQLKTSPNLIELPISIVSVQVAETDVFNGSAQATLFMSSLRNVGHIFVNDFYAGMFF